jgi:uncharacterized membrane protein
MRVRLPGLYIALGLALAGLIHIVAVLMLPSLAPRNAHARLAELGPPNTMIEIPAAIPGRQVMPMMAPDIRYAFCRFDLAEGPVRLKAAVPDELWLIALYTPEGDNFYSVVGADMKRPEIELVITSPEQTVEEAGVDAPEGSEDVIVVNAPVSEGIALIRAPLAGPSRALYAERALKATSCARYVKPAPPPDIAPLPAGTPEDLEDGAGAEPR